MTPLIEQNINPFIKLFKHLYLGMIMTDPCKKCIVKPCCSKECKEKYTYRDIFDMGVLYGRILSWVAAVNIVIIFPWALFTIIFK